MKIQLTLTEEQAKVVSAACEFYARIKMGQFDEIIINTLDIGISIDDYCARRDRAHDLLFEARKELLPELHGYGHSYGIGKFKDADQAFDVYQVLRQQFGDEREPFSYYELPECKRIDDASLKNVRLAIPLALARG